MGYVCVYVYVCMCVCFETDAWANDTSINVYVDIHTKDADECVYIHVCITYIVRTCWYR